MNTDLFEIMRTTRSMRRLKPDPVPTELIRQILEAGTSAPPAATMAHWRFLVIRDQGIKDAVACRYRRAWHETVGPWFRSAGPGTGAPAPGPSRDRYDRMLNAADYLADHLHEAPVWIVPCLLGETHNWESGSAIYPAVQNMLLAARALGLGATLTTLFQSCEKDADAALGLPPSARSYAILPIGYPLGNFGPVARTALEDVVFIDRWGEQWLDEPERTQRSADTRRL
jgi:nitroreductase